MILSRYTLKNINNNGTVIPNETLFELPEKVLQFGTGVLLRGLPDYFIDKANRQGIFNGRIVIVKSTSHGDSSAFDKQDGLYTLCVRGLENGERVEENIINSSVSRVLSAAEEWAQVLECAHNQALQVIISNTTEVGIQLMNDDIRHHPPKSYPGKLLAFLYERYRAFDGSKQSGMVIVPTELIPNNGEKLQSIVLELAHLNGLEPSFIEWLDESNYFCNSLVDRIVPGAPETGVKATIESELGYSDDLLIMAEPYRLWAIEGNEHVKNVLSFYQADEGVVIQPDIDLFRELKLRLLNGTHTLSCGLAFLAGLDTVSKAMQDEGLRTFITDLMQKEIAPAIPYTVEPTVALNFSSRVLDRFSNTYIKHFWINITMQYSSKMKMRCIPLLLKHYQSMETPPELFTLGFAAYLYFMKPVRKSGDKYYGELNGQTYLIQDEQAEQYYKRWMGLSTVALVQDVLGDTLFWGYDLRALPGFENGIIEKLNLIINSGIRIALKNTLSKNVFAHES